MLAKRNENAGDANPLMMAQMVPTKMSGHSDVLRRMISRKDTGGISSSCVKKDIQHMIHCATSSVLKFSLSHFLCFLFFNKKN